MTQIKFHLIYLLPLIGFLINGLAGKKLPKSISGWLGAIMILIPFSISALLFKELLEGGSATEFTLLDWISAGDVSIQIGFLFDQLSILWLLIITGIGFLIHVYSISYMHDDENFSRFFAYLNLFVFFMLLLVLGNNLLVTFIGWEGVGLCSYLLIGFWYKNQAYNDAAKKAFIMNRIGDLGFLIGMFLLLFYFGTIDYSGLRSTVQNTSENHHIIVLATLFLFIGACGKSAQLPLYTWLPDAMAGPTPVSALIHAATMVTAGIYLIVRTNFLFSMAPETLTVIAIVGCATALFAAIIGILQNDIKKILAYSTVSQLGLMFMALGLGAYVSGVFHVLTHAFFKACLFLGSGSVIHALHGEQSIRKMGALKKWMPITFGTFILATLAISGIPPFSGFVSKDEILAQAFMHNKVLWVIASIASALTAFYMFRLVFVTFYGEFRGTEEQRKHMHESPALITIPLVVLAILSVVGGVMGLPAVVSNTHWLNNFLSEIVPHQHGHHLSHATEWMLIGIAVAVAIVSIVIAYIKYISGKQVPENEESLTGISAVISNKFYVDEIYNLLVVKPVQFLSEMFHDILDKVAIDGIVNSLGKLSLFAGRQLKMIQNGNIGFYLVFMIVALCILITKVFYL